MGFLDRFKSVAIAGERADDARGKRESSAKQPADELLAAAKETVRRLDSMSSRALFAAMRTRVLTYFKTGPNELPDTVVDDQQRTTETVRRGISAQYPLQDGAVISLVLGRNDYGENIVFVSYIGDSLVIGRGIPQPSPNARPSDIVDVKRLDPVNQDNGRIVDSPLFRGLDPELRMKMGSGSIRAVTIGTEGTNHIVADGSSGGIGENHCTLYFTEESSGTPATMVIRDSSSNGTLIREHVHH